MTRGRDKWIKRKIRTYHKGTVTQSLLVGDVLGEIGLTDSVAIKILGFTAWNVTNPGKTTNFIFAETEPTMTLSEVRVEATDHGSSTSLPGVRVNIPDTLARTYNGSNLTTTILVKITPSPYSATIVDEQNFVVDWLILWNATADQ